MAFRPRAAWIVLLLFFASVGNAENFVLFSAPGVLSATYDSIVEKLQPNDTIEFSDQTRFTLGKRLDGSRGTTTMIWEILEPGPGGVSQVVRIPLHSRLMRNGQRPKAYIDQTIQGEATLASHEIPRVRVLGHRNREYVLVERIPKYRSFIDYLRSTDENTQLLDDLKEFARRTSGLARIGDFKPSQIVHVDGRGWIVLDWIDSAVPARSTYSDDVFSSFEKMLPANSRELAKWLAIYDKYLFPEIMKTRKAELKPSVWVRALECVRKNLNRAITQAQTN